MITEGRNVWREARADRLAILIDNQAYFDALAKALQKARRSIVILGWQFDPRTRLSPEGATREGRCEIGLLLRRLARERPGLEAKILIWRSPLPIAWSQDFFPQRARAWFRRRPVDFRLDRARPPGACHHQKVVVIDGRLAFCGGGDIAVDRWDTPEHLDLQPLRRSPNGRRFPPRHEVMALVDGPAARALEDLALRRWRDATGEAAPPAPDEEAGDPWPEGVTPWVEGAHCGLARTLPAWRADPGASESLSLHLDAIAAARRLIYLENQYVTSPVVAAALARRLGEAEGPEVVIITTARAPSWFDHAAMDTARGWVLAQLRAADVHGRLGLWAPFTARGAPVIVHAKTSVIDDVLVRIGSTNLNNRSMGFDTECDLAVALRPDQAFAARRLRAWLLGHFLHVAPDRVEAAHADLGSLNAAIGALNPQGRLRPLGNRDPSAAARLVSAWQIGDPTGPGDAWRPWRRARLSRLLKAQARRQVPTPSSPPPGSDLEIDHEGKVVGSHAGQGRPGRLRGRDPDGVGNKDVIDAQDGKG